MLLQDSRRAARTTATGDVVLLEDQDRTRGTAAEIEEGLALTRRALASRRFGPYTLQAAIAAEHAQAATPRRPTGTASSRPTTSCSRPSRPP